jgi:hypothetical protein
MLLVSCLKRLYASDNRPSKVKNDTIYNNLQNIFNPNNTLGPHCQPQKSPKVYKAIRMSGCFTYRC